MREFASAIAETNLGMISRPSLESPVLIRASDDSLVTAGQETDGLGVESGCAKLLVDVTHSLFSKVGDVIGGSGSDTILAEKGKGFNLHCFICFGLVAPVGLEPTTFAL